MRGLLSMLYLTALEAELGRQSNNPKPRLAEYFDLIAGTSTGGILTALMTTPDLEEPTRPRFCAAETCDMFLHHLPQVFSNVRRRAGQGILSEKYDGRSMAMVMRAAFGGVRLSNLTRPSLITAYDIHSHQSIFFCSHDYYNSQTRKQHRLAPEPTIKQDWLLRDICCATSAAPVFFASASIGPVGNLKDKHNFLDGGIFANNPALCAYAEVRAKWKGGLGVADMIMLSMGTGIVQQKIHSGGYLTGWGGGIGLISLLTESGTESVHFAMQRIYGESLAHQYHRLNWHLLEDCQPDNISSAKINQLMATFTGQPRPPKKAACKSWGEMGAKTAAYIPEAQREQLQRIASQLLQQQADQK